MVIETMTLFSGLGRDGTAMGRLSLRVAERRGVANGDGKGSRRAISDARRESIAQHVRGHDEQSAF